MWAKACFRIREQLIQRPLWTLNTYWLRFLGMRIGRGTLLPPCAVTWPHQVSLGTSCRIEHNVYFHFDGTYKEGPSIVLGNNSFIGAGVEFNITLSFEAGHHSLIAAGTRFVDHDHDTMGPYDQVASSKGLAKPIRLGNYVWIGCNAIILKGVIIGDGAIIGAGSVVNSSIPSNEIWAGVPAKKIGLRAHYS
jgi:acetyltransferase-like isoleucine patch superfamily enzyme